MERFAIIGLGRFGTRLARLLSEAGAEVIAIDRNKSMVERVRDDVTRAVALDATDEEALRSQGIDTVDVAVVGIGTAFESAVLSTVLLKQLQIPRVIARATSVIRGQILSRVGADDIVNPESESAERWKNRLMAPEIMERIELAEDFSLVQLSAPSAFTGKTLGQLDLRKKYQIQVIGIRRTVEETDAEGVKRTQQLVISVPMAESTIKQGDVLLIIGTDQAIKRLPRE